LTDIRREVVQDRGILKKVQAWLPGYKTYRTCEDLRIADSLLRKELAKKLEAVESDVNKARKEIAVSMEFDLINRIGELVNTAHKITEKVRHAEQGYAPWISADVRIQEDELNALYEFDLSMFERTAKIMDMSKALRDASESRSADRMEKIRGLRSAIEGFEKEFDQRISAISRVAQK
jgi:hypothetical protein